MEPLEIHHDVDPENGSRPPDPSGFNSQAALAKDAHGLAAHLRQKIVQFGVRGRLRPSRNL